MRKREGRKDARASGESDEKDGHGRDGEEEASRGFRLGPSLSKFGATSSG